ncbi:MAG: thiamine pyrophosphate-dependent dehydrogenase E1 component subunit alpha [Bacteroidota bacterium]
MSKDNGKDKELEPVSEESFDQQVKRLGLSDETLIDLYRTMCTVRHFEYMADKLYAAGKVHGTMHLSAGQEAVAAGISLAVHPDDYLINHHRGHGHFIAKGADINLMMAEFLGKDTGYNHGRGGSMHIADFQSNNLGANGIVGGGIPQAVGVGLALQMQKRHEICICIFGDGAANEGVFHEAMNMVALWKLPVLYVCENNKYGMSMDVERATAKLPIAQRADAYGIPWACVDGNNVIEVYDAMKIAADYVRSGKGPYFVETITYRYFGHSKSDRNLYRSKEEIEDWKQNRDPIIRYTKNLLQAEILGDSQAQQIDTDAELVIVKAVEFAESSPEPDLSTLMEYVYA